LYDAKFLRVNEESTFGVTNEGVRKPHSGSYSVELDRSNGTRTSVVRDYTPPRQ